MKKIYFDQNAKKHQGCTIQARYESNTNRTSVHNRLWHFSYDWYTKEIFPMKTVSQYNKEVLWWSDMTWGTNKTAYMKKNCIDPQAIHNECCQEARKTIYLR